MFCKFCGKETDNLNGVCNDCTKIIASYECCKDKKEDAAATALNTQFISETYCDKGTKGPYTVTYGLTDAISCIIISLISFTFIIITPLLTKLYPTMIMLPLCTFVPGMIFSAFGLRKGIFSILNYKKARAHGSNPLATLILGIAGALISGLSIILFMIFIILLFMSLIKTAV